MVLSGCLRDRRGADGLVVLVMGFVCGFGLFWPCVWWFACEIGVVGMGLLGSCFDGFAWHTPHHRVFPLTPSFLVSD